VTVYPAQRKTPGLFRDRGFRCRCLAVTYFTPGILPSALRAGGAVAPPFKIAPRDFVTAFEQVTARPKEKPPASFETGGFVVGAWQ